MCISKALRFVAVLVALTLLCWDVQGQSLTDQWNKLYSQFDAAITQHEETLLRLQGEIEEAKQSTDEMSTLLIELQMQNDTLRTFNEQIGERMQDRDEELASLYDDYDKIQTKYKLFRGMFAVLCAAIGLFLAVNVARIFI